MATTTRDREERDDVLVKYVSDQLAAEHHTLDVIKQQQADSDVQAMPEVAALVDSIALTLKEHVDHLQRHLEQDLKQEGGKISALLKGAVTEVTGTVTGLYNKVRSEKVSKMLRDDYAALSMCSLTNTMLHATALGIGSSKTAEIALEHLNDLPSLVIELNRIIPVVVISELSERGVVTDPSAANEAIRKSQEAWSMSHQEEHIPRVSM